MTDVESMAAALAAELVGIDSVNPALVPGGAGETAIVGHLEARLRDAGFDTTVVTRMAARAGRAWSLEDRGRTTSRPSSSTATSTPSA